MNKKIAAIQMASGPQIKANLMEATRLIREAASKGAGIITMNINLAAQKKVRKSFPVLQHVKL